MISGKTLIALGLGLVLAACTNTVTDDTDDTDDNDGGSSSTSSSSSSGEGGSGGSTSSSGAGGDCDPSSYPESCAEIPSFQCGFEYHCEDGVVTVNWHEHVMCGDEEIFDYSCTYECEAGCTEDYSDWPQSGEQLIQDVCLVIDSAS